MHHLLPPKPQKDDSMRVTVAEDGAFAVGAASLDNLIAAVV
jgi:hypothetical protein